MAEQTFYRLWHSPDKLEPGAQLALERKVEFVSWGVNASDLPQLVRLTPEKLQTQREASTAAENAILKEMQKSAEVWEAQAVQTMLLDRAMEYLETPAVTHTGNEWVEQKDGIWEISNLVYKMRYRVAEETAGKRKGQWLATWGIAINRPRRPPGEKYYYTGEIIVVEQKKKYYNAEAEARRYIQNRFDQYAILFSELSPPVPAKYQRHFHIHGILLPGYTIAPPERSPQEVADNLLALLEPDDLPLQIAPKTKPPAKKKPGPVR